jgi:uncharacterized protein (DUF952 family)
VTIGASLVYHLAPSSALRRDLRGDTYAPPSLAAEGFIHCTATPALTLQVAIDYFAKLAEPLLVLAIDPAKLRARLVFEAPAPIAGGGTAHLASGVTFPHLYGALDLAAVVGAAELRRDGDAFAWPAAFGPLDAWLGRARGGV